jgi:hypothetical protein
MKNKGKNLHLRQRKIVATQIGIAQLQKYGPVTKTLIFRKNWDCTASRVVPPHCSERIEDSPNGDSHPLTGYGTATLFPR